MASVVTEHMLLLVPMMMVVMIFPMVAGFVVNNYNNEQRLLAVEQASAKLGSAIQQVYLVTSNDNVKDSVVTLTNPLPQSLETQQYIVTGTQEGESLTLHIGLPGVNLWYDHKITLGQNAVWDPASRLDSNSPTTGIVARKVSGKIYLSFG
jgi:hypothetical protein